MRLTDCGVMGRGPRVGGLCAGGVGAKQAGSEDRRAQMAAWGAEPGPRVSRVRRGWGRRCSDSGGGGWNFLGVLKLGGRGLVRKGLIKVKKSARH